MCPDGVLDHPIQFFLDVISFRLRGLYPMAFQEWREYIRTPKKLCVCQTPSETVLVYDDRTKTVREEVNTEIMTKVLMMLHLYILFSLTSSSRLRAKILMARSVGSLVIGVVSGITATAWESPLITS